MRVWGFEISRVISDFYPSIKIAVEFIYTHTDSFLFDYSFTTNQLTYLVICILIPSPIVIGMIIVLSLIVTNNFTTIARTVKAQKANLNLTIQTSPF